MKLEEKIGCLLLDQILAAAFWHGEHAFWVRCVWRPLRKQLSGESNANRNRRDLSVRWPSASREGNPRSPMFPFGWSKDWQGRCPASSNRFMACSRSPSRLPLSKWAGKSSSFHSLCREPRGEAALYDFCQAPVEPVQRWMINGGPERFLSLLDLGGLKYSYGQALNCSVYTKQNWAQLNPLITKWTKHKKNGTTAVGHQDFWLLQWALGWVCDSPLHPHCRWGQQPASLAVKAAPRSFQPNFWGRTMQVCRDFHDLLLLRV